MSFRDKWGMFEVTPRTILHTTNPIPEAEIAHDLKNSKNRDSNPIRGYLLSTSALRQHFGVNKRTPAEIWPRFLVTCPGVVSRTLRWVAD